MSSISILPRRKAIAALAVTLSLSAGASALASDFSLTTLPSFSTELSLKDHEGQTFYDFMKNELKDKMNGRRQSGDDDELLRNGSAVAVKLDEKNYNLHVNYFDSPQSGRSYGWTRGQVGDWSDRAILTNLITVTKGTDQELKDFYTALVQMVGDCDASSLSKLHGMTERVATNFLAIYAAEEYRATLGTQNWDDALFETTLLAAFHAGQRTVTKYYMGKLSDRSFKQAPGVYNSRGPVAVRPDASTEKAADLTDYWQFSANPQRRNSGINETRPDFEKMGKMITAYESDNADIQAIERIVRGSGENVIKDVTKYFAAGNADASNASELAKHVASLMVRVRADADKITTYARTH